MSLLASCSGRGATRARRWWPYRSRTWWAAPSRKPREPRQRPFAWWWFRACQGQQSPWCSCRRPWRWWRREPWLQGFHWPCEPCLQPLHGASPAARASSWGRPVPQQSGRCPNPQTWPAPEPWWRARRPARGW